MGIFRNKNIIRALKVLLPLLLIFYFSAITFFPHRHVINDVFVVHSHPYKKNACGEPDHTHTPDEIVIIQNLSTYQVTDVIILSVIFTLFLLKPRNVNTRIYRFVHINYISYYSFLRPPPFLFLLK